jgi:hypothetical protein
MRGVELHPLEIAVFATFGVVAGLGLLLRGFAGYREAARIGDTATSSIASLAIGEVRVSGVVEPAELTLVSPLQSSRCVFYRASIAQSSDGDDDTLFEEERAVGFRVRDPSGSVRVFPRDARFDVPARFVESTGPFGETPPGLHLRTGSAMAAAEPTREEQIAALLTVRPAVAGGLPDTDAGWLGGGLTGLGGGSRARRYREARIQPGDVVTVVGQVLPFDQLPDPAAADLGGSASDPVGALSDPEIAHDIATARAAGTLADTPEEAWGNAAIPGFGVGRPVSSPVLDPGATRPPLASAEEAARVERTFEIAPRDLVVAAAPDAPLVVAFGAPDVAAARHQTTFLVGLLGALLAIGSAVALALAVGGLGA